MLASFLVDLSERTRNIIGVIFPAENIVDVQLLMREECSKLKLGCDDWSDMQFERIWFGVLKMSNGDSIKLLDAVVLAQADWRDLLMAAGFGDDLDSHSKWADQYES